MEKPAKTSQELAGQTEPVQPNTPNFAQSGDETSGSLSADAEIQSEKPFARKVTGVSWFLVVSAMLGSTFLYALDNTVVADVGADVIRSLGELEKFPWLGTAFTWASMSTILVWSKIYDLFDAKFLYIFASFLFEVGSALCGAAPTMNAMIIGRAIAGLGASGIYVGSLTLISVNTSEQERPTYIGYTGLSWGSGFVLGPVIGGAFAQSKATWRWAFYINLVLFGVFAPILVFLVPRWDPRKNETFKQRARHIDWLGSTLEISASLAGIMAISFGGTTYAWNSGQTIGLFVTAGVLSMLFGLQQHFKFLTSFEDRIFPLQFLKSKHMLVFWTLIAAPAAAVLGPIYFLPIFFQFVHGDNPIEAAVRLLPIIITFVFGALCGGAVVSKTGRYYPWFLFGGICTTIGSSLLFADISITSSASKIYGYTALMGIGTGAAGQLSYSAAQVKVDPKYIPSTIGFICMGQYVGLTLALCMSGAIFNNLSLKYVAALLPPGTPTEVVRYVIQGIDTATLQEQSEETKIKILEAIVKAISKTFPISITAGVAMIAATLLLKPNEKVSFRK